jgi:hypothetical protein
MDMLQASSELQQRRYKQKPFFQNRSRTSQTLYSGHPTLPAPASETPANHEGLAHSCCHLLCGLCSLATQPFPVGGLWQLLIAVLGVQQS